MNYIKQIKLHTKAVNQCFLMIENIEILLNYNCLSVSEIFNRLSESDVYLYLSFIKNINNNIKTGTSDYILSNENIKVIQDNLYLSKTDKDNLISYFSILGKSDLNGQIANCKTYKEIFKKILIDLEKEETSQCKCTGTLIIGAGILLIILII